MRTIGLIGGMSWESSAEYYRLINEEVNRRLGGLHSARCLLWSFDFADIELLQGSARWAEATALITGAAQSLEMAGAEMILICTNTMHKMADDVAASVGLPLVHIADATAGAVRAEGLERVGLLATRYTMEEDFYRGRLERHHGLEVRVPDEADRLLVHRVIYEELCLGIVNAASKAAYLEVIGRLVEDGAQGIVLGCTEIGMLVSQEDCDVPIFDTTVLHARAAVDLALT